MFDHRDDSNKWSNIGFSQEITQVESIEVNFTHLIWSSGYHEKSICTNYLKVVLEANKLDPDQVLPMWDLILALACLLLEKNPD